MRTTPHTAPTMAFGLGCRPAQRGGYKHDRNVLGYGTAPHRAQFR